ncbi:MAG TPA: elongation factor P hydroxylase [Pseudomonadales bacterium]|nr:elongation factor P hydroxylase [Pseudomonadales bacterium]
MQHNADDLITLFNQLFETTENTILVRGLDEPIYLPAGSDSPYHPSPAAQVVFAHGYFSSALHEISHWCIAGDQRRTQVDYGYWYRPDGRTKAEQQEFEKVEAKPQALEWMLNVAAGSRFRLSADNLSGEPTDPTAFKEAVYTQLQHYLRDGVPPRAKKFIEALAAFYSVALPLRLDYFNFSELR